MCKSLAYVNICASRSSINLVQKLHGIQVNERLTMMKKLLFLITLSILVVGQLSLQGQSLTLSWEGEVLGDTVSVLPSAEEELSFNAIVNNISDNSFMVLAARVELDMPDGTTSNFKWEQDYGPTTDTATAAKFIPASGSSDTLTFIGRYKPNGSTDVAIIKYSFFREDNHDDVVEVVVKYMHTPNAVEENLSQGVRFSDIYPNPCDQMVNFDYTIDRNREGTASLKIVNLLGATVREHQIDRDNNKLHLDVSDLEGGIYFYSILMGEEVLQTKKLIVR